MQQTDLIVPKRVLKCLKEPHPQFLNNAFCDPYSGCEFGCLYCYGLKEEIVDRGEAASPWRVGVKTPCAFSLKKELGLLTQETAGTREGKNSIGFGFASDPYQPCEEQFRLTERCLEIMKENSFPIQVITKSELVLRDKKILSELSGEGLAVVSVSLFTLNEEISGIFEPRVPPPVKRLELIRKLRKENIVCGAVLMPIFPYLTDSEKEMDEIFSELASAGALYCVPGVLSLARPEVRKRVFKTLGGKFSKTKDQYEALYDKLGHPALNYCERIDKILRTISEKHQIPTVLPVEAGKEKGSLIVRDAL
jgi:DNA repair photolyase